MSLFKRKQKTITTKIKNNDDDFDDLDFNFDDDDDFADTFNDDKPRKKRSVIVRVGKGVLKGVKSHTFDFKRHKKEVLKGFPDLVSDTIDTIQDSADSLADQMRETYGASKGDLRDIARTVEKMVPSRYERLKKRATTVAEHFSSEMPDTVSPERAREDSITSALSEIFSATQANDDVRFKQEQAQATMSEALANQRHKETKFQLGKIHESVAMNNTFNIKVTTAFQKKLLELQYRSYYVQADMLATMKNTDKATKALLDGILNNTALPDYAKMNMSDRFKATARKELFDLAKDKVFSKDGYLNNLMGMAKEKIKGTNLGGITEALQGLLMMEETGTDFIEYAAQLLTSEVLLPKYSKKLIKKGMEKFVPKDSEAYQKIIRLTTALQNPGKMGEKLADILEESAYSDNIISSLFGEFIGTPLADVLRSANHGKSKSVDLRQKDEDLLSAAAFNKITQTSITKIIPGFLARILQQTERNANISSLSYKGSMENLKATMPEMIHYNPYDGEFQKQTLFRKQIDKKIREETNVASTASDFYDIGDVFTFSKKGLGQRNQAMANAKARIPELIKQLSELGKAIGPLYEANKKRIIYNKEHTENQLPIAYEISTQSEKADFLKEITDLKKEISDFREEYISNDSPVALIPFDEFYRLEQNARSLFKRVAKISDVLKEETAVRSSVAGLTRRFHQGAQKTSGINRNMEKERASYKNTDRRLLGKFSYAASMEGYDVSEYQEASRDKRFRNQLILDGIFTEEELDHIQQLLRKSEVYQNEELKLHMTHKVNQTRERMSNGNTTAARLDELLGRDALGGTYDVKGHGSEVHRSERSFAKEFENELDTKMKQNDLRFWQTNVLNKVTSKTTRMKFDQMMNLLQPSQRQKLLSYVQSNVTNPSELENAINNILVKYKDYRTTPERGSFFEKLTTEEELPDYETTFKSDRTLKQIHYNRGNAKKSAKGADNKGYAARIAQLNGGQVWSYKGDPNHVKHRGYMAQDIQKAFGDEAAPGGKKVDVPSMFGVMGESLKEVYNGLHDYQASTTAAIKGLKEQAAAYYSANLATRGISPKGIVEIFDKSTSVESISSVVEKAVTGAGRAKGIFKDAWTRAVYTKNEAGEYVTSRADGARTRFTAAKDKVKGQSERVRGYIREHKPIKTGFGKLNNGIQNLSQALNENENLQGGFLANAAARFASDADKIINAGNNEERASALSDMLITLIAGGVEKIGQGSRFAYAHTLKHVVGRSVKYAKSVQGVHCMSSVYLGRENLPPAAPVLASRNYKTTVLEEMYFDTKTHKRITSACHIKGGVSRYNGDVIFTAEEAKEQGLYVIDHDGHPIKLGGLKFLAALGTNAAIGMSKFLAHKIMKNPLVTRGIRSAKWIGNTRLGKKVRRSFLGRRTGDLRDIGLATYRTFMGDNQLAPVLAEKLDKIKNHNYGTGRFTGRLSKWAAMAGDAAAGTVHDEDGYYDEDQRAQRSFENSIIKDQRHYENVSSKLTEDQRQEAYLKDFNRIAKNRRLTKDQKRALIHRAHVKHLGTMNPNAGPINFANLTKKGVKANRKGILRKVVGGMGDMARHPAKSLLKGLTYGAGGMVIMSALGPLILPAAGAYVGYKAITHDLFHRGSIRGAIKGGLSKKVHFGNPFRRRKPTEPQASSAQETAELYEATQAEDTVLHPHQGWGNAQKKKQDKLNKEHAGLIHGILHHVPFYDTMVNGIERRRGGVHYMEAKDKKKKPMEDVVNNYYGHKNKKGMGLLGSLATGAMHMFGGLLKDFGGIIKDGLEAGGLYEAAKIIAKRSIGAVWKGGKRVIESGAGYAWKKGKDAFKWARKILSRKKGKIGDATDDTADVAGDAADVADVGDAAEATGAVADTAMTAAGSLEVAGAAADATGVGLPVGLILAVAGGLTAVYATFHKQINKTVDWGLGKLKQAGSWFLGKVGSAWNAFKNSDFAKFSKDLFHTGGEALKAADATAADWISGGHNYTLTGAVSHDAKRVGHFAVKTFDAAVTNVTHAFDYIKKKVVTAADVIGGIFNKVGVTVEKTFQWLYNHIPGLKGAVSLADKAYKVGAKAAKAAYHVGKQAVMAPIHGVEDIASGVYHIFGASNRKAVKAAGHGLMPDGYYTHIRAAANAPIPIKNNNPGFITTWPKQSSLPRVGGYIKFPSPLAGLEAFGATIRYYISKGHSTLPELLKILAMPGYMSSPVQFMNTVESASKFSATATLGQTSADLYSLMVGILTAQYGHLYYRHAMIETAAKNSASGSVLAKVGKRAVTHTTPKGAPKANPVKAKVAKVTAKAIAAANKKSAVQKRGPGSSLASMTGFWGNLFEFDKAAKSDIASVKYAGQAGKYGVPGYNPQSQGVYTGKISPQSQLAVAQDLSLSQKETEAKIRQISDAHHFETEYLLVVAARESGLEAWQKNPNSTASGLFQYIVGTWSDKLNQYGKMYNIPSTASPFSIKYSTIVAGASVISDANLVSKVKPDVYYVDLYMIHFLGVGGGPHFLRLLTQIPNKAAADYFSAQAAVNQAYFYKDGKALSFKDCYDTIANFFSNSASSFGLKGRAFDTVKGYGTSKPTASIKAKSAKMIKRAKEVVKKAASPKPAPMPVPTTAPTRLPIPTIQSSRTATMTAPAPRLMTRTRAPKSSDQAVIQTNHLANVVSINKEMSEMLRQQLIIQTQSMHYLKHIAQQAAPKTTSAPVVNAPVAPIAPEPKVRIGPRNKDW